MKPRVLKAYNSFINLVSESGYKLISDYVGSMVKVDLICPYNHTYSVTPNNFKKGSRCPVCSKHCPTTAEQSFLKMLEDCQYTTVDPYMGVSYKHAIVCNVGHSFSATPDNMLRRSSRCPKCASIRNSILKKEKSFNELKILCDDIKYTIIDKYVKNSVKIGIVCNNGHRFRMTPNCLKSGQRCPECAEYGYNSSKSGSVYLVRWLHKETNHSFLKYGITNRDCEVRISQQATKTNYTLSIITTRTFEDGAIPQKFERLIESNIKTGVVGKDMFSDGFTETVEDTTENEQYIVNSIKQIKL